MAIDDFEEHRPKLGRLEGIVKGAKVVHGVGKLAHSSFRNEDFDAHADYIIKNDALVRAYTERDPKYRTLLRQTLEDLYPVHRPYLIGGDLIDKWDVLTSLVGEGAELFPGAGTAISAGEEVVELVPKIAYSAAYALGTGDYQAIPYWAANEVASFIPVVGDMIDMKAIYRDRARENFRKNATDLFMKKVSSTSVVQ